MASVKTEWNGPEFKAALLAAAKTALVETGTAIVGDAKRNLNAFKPAGNDTGTLLRSIGMSKVQIDRRGPVLYVGIKGGMKDPAIYAMVVEYGRRAGAKAPPSRALEGWVKRRLKPKAKLNKRRKITRKTMSKSARGLESGRAKDAAIKSVAFLVARSIGKKGIKPKPYMRPAFAKHKDKILPRYQAALKIEIEKRGVGVKPNG